MRMHTLFFRFKTGMSCPKRKGFLGVSGSFEQCKAVSQERERERFYCRRGGNARLVFYFSEMYCCFWELCEVIFFFSFRLKHGFYSFQVFVCVAFSAIKTIFSAGYTPTWTVSENTAVQLACHLLSSAPLYSCGWKVYRHFKLNLIILVCKNSGLIKLER